MKNNLMDCFIFRGENIISVQQASNLAKASELFDEVVFDESGNFVKGAEPMAMYEDNKVVKGIYSMLVE